MKTTHRKESRRNKRYPVKEYSFAVVRSKNYYLDEIDSLSKGEIAFAVIKSKPPRMGQIVDISRNGLSFDYIDNEENCSGSTEMDILVVDDNFILSRLPFKLVREARVDRDMPFNSLNMKRMTVQFSDLTYKQKRKLELFLERYALRKEIGKEKSTTSADRQISTTS